MNRKTLKKVLITAVQIALAVFLLFFILMKIDIHGIRSALLQAIGPGLMGPIAISLVTKYAYALQMRQGLYSQGISIPVLRLVRVYLITSFYAFVIPSDLAAGGITWAKLGRESNAWTASGITIVYLRLLNTLLLFILGIFGIYFDPLFSSARFRPVFIAGILLLCFVLLPFVSRTAAGSLVKFTSRIGSLLPDVLRLNRVVKTLIAVISEFPRHSRNQFFKNIALSILIHGCNIALLFAASHTLSLHLPFSVMLWLWPVITLISLFPFAFGGLGVREGLLILILSPYDISDAQKVAFSLLLYSVSFITGGLPGAWFEIKDVLFSRKRESSNVGRSNRHRLEGMQ